MSHFIIFDSSGLQTVVAWSTKEYVLDYDSVYIGLVNPFYLFLSYH
jgi:hypothetical protein